MSSRKNATPTVATVCAIVGLSLAAPQLARAEAEDADVKHVLLISVDGMHQQDLARCLTDKTCPNLAKLARHGVNYTNAYAPGLTDSVPGLAALVTGGSPRSTGLFYDDIYDRTLYAGTDTNCTGPQGVEVFLQEVVGIDAVNGGALVHLDGGGAFNPQQLPRRKVGSTCMPVYPHDFIQTNTIFEVVKKHVRGSHTAWADKHAWGTDWVNGPSGKGVDDLARTEINSTVALPSTTTRARSTAWCRPICIQRCSTTSTSASSSTRSTAKIPPAPRRRCPPSSAPTSRR